MIGKCFTTAKATAGLSLAALLLTVAQAHGQQNSTSFPWNSGYQNSGNRGSGYQGYNEPRYVTQPLSPVAVPAAPVQYQLYVTTLPEKNVEAPTTALMIAHVADNAMIWIGGEPTTSTGDTRTFITPPLKEGKKSTYTVRVDWIEDGKQVGQTQEIPVKAGGFHCIYLVKSGSKLDPKTTVIEENIAKLSPEDRELAKSQKFCAVQDGVPLGAHGVPVKVMLNKQPVLLCCEACMDRATANADKTLAKAKELKGKLEMPPVK
jgi:uncharacterized protein (TIGR03000 family)